jgi:ABC-2 type transport system ATP-binding protein
MTADLRDLTIRRAGRDILSGITLSIRPGVIGLLGPNGAGKTTLLRSLATLAAPASGQLEVLGLSVTASTRERDLRRVFGRLGYLPQRLPALPWFTALEYVTYVGWTKGMSASSARGRAAELLEVLELQDRAHSRLRSLSGGMVQRVGIAQAFVNDPDLVLLDEPTAGLDPRQRVVFRAVVKEAGGRAAVVLATHLVDDVGPVCDRVAVLNGGELRFDGTAAELANRSTHDALGDSALERGFHSVVGNGAVSSAHSSLSA